MNMRLAVLTASLITSPLGAQTAAEHIVMGDRDHAAMNAVSALRHYQDAIRVDPDNAEALWRARRVRRRCCSGDRVERQALPSARPMRR